MSGFSIDFKIKLLSRVRSSFKDHTVIGLGSPVNESYKMLNNLKREIEQRATSNEFLDAETYADLLVSSFAEENMLAEASSEDGFKSLHGLNEHYVSLCENASESSLKKELITRRNAQFYYIKPGDSKILFRMGYVEEVHKDYFILNSHDGSFKSFRYDRILNYEKSARESTAESYPVQIVFDSSVDRFSRTLKIAVSQSKDSNLKVIETSDGSIRIEIQISS